MEIQSYVEKLKEDVLKIIEKAKKAGADDVFVSASYANATRIGYEKNDFNVAAMHEGTGFSITVHKNNKSGSASINTFDEKKIDKTISDALQMAECTIPDPCLDLAPKSEYKILEPQFNEKIVSMTMRDIRKKAELMLNPLFEESKICIDNASVDKTMGARVIGNSRGMLATDYSSSLSWSLMGMAKDGDELTSFDYLNDFSYTPEDIDSKIKHTVTKFKRKVLNSLGAQSCPTFQGKLLLSPSLVEEFIVDPMMYHICGSNIMDGKSRWADALGKTVCHKNIHIEDRPFDRELRGCTVFSGEGVPTSEMVIVKEGILSKHLDSIYSAKKRGVTPTGNGAGAHCPWVKPGDSSLEELISEAESFMLEPGRFSGNLDCITGDFSGVAKGSYLYENGDRKKAVKEVMISGNIFDMIKKEVLFSNQQETEGGCFRIPWAVVDGVSVVGA